MCTISETKVTADKTFVQWAYSITHQGDKNKILSVPFIRPFANVVLEEKIKEIARVLGSEGETPYVELIS